MSPRKQPNTLFSVCIKYTLNLINDCCYTIEKSYPEIEYTECKRKVLGLKKYLSDMLPVRLFDALCLERGVIRYRGDPRIQLHVLLHPNMSIFHRSDIDTSIPQVYWTSILTMFERLVVLDLKFICTDEILEVISKNCNLLEELNIVSKVNIHKSRINASVLIRYVSDAGLKYVATIKSLRILSMDPPRNERAQRVGRCVTQPGVIMLVSELPYLEELRIESCDIGSTLINTDTKLGPLGLRKINSHFASPEGVRKLIKICPVLRELSVTHLSTHDKDGIMEQIAQSDLRLNKLDLSFFSFTDAMQQLLAVKGEYLTHFALWEMDHVMNINAVISIGSCCPNLTTLCLMTQSTALSIPRFFRRPTNIFNKLKNLTLGNENFDIENLLIYLLECTNKMQKMALKYQTKLEMDSTLLFLLRNGFLKNLTYLWLDCTLEVSKNTVFQVIEKCEHLTMLTVDLIGEMNEVQKYIAENNLDLRLGGY
ncbi:uncharacterized protein [Epargyreus clarus]|uniref:uncharacterized protein n=1 Tax=Epargyreus clarus TaxID=520877 RepID=UPI003C306DA0